MTWWVWVLIAWAFAATVAAVWFGLALANAEVQDYVRRVRESETVSRR